ncbi:Retrovirus-related Pol polyprotein from transposon TNT 1-94 [Melia azedarach]|uniref:Retrovirus-related Pol polyprotein from transposon TNT 1-94 n=1 Tax=Melia azedarach TaxID=155640 RepID=A0ACC1YXY7_MELAZ|nr:Retrovirus-related Pol polyprotein from transposon TNT 1-94 [Melia azedarach]
MDECIEAIYDEMRSLHENYTFELVKLSEGRKALKNKWMFRIKQDEHSLRCNIRQDLLLKVLGRGKTLILEIFSPVVKMTSIHIVLGLAVSLNLEIEQMDVKIALLYDDLEEEIYIEQPEKFKEDYLCKLKKRFYGLKQVLRQWYKKFESVMWEQDYKKTTSDSCVLCKSSWVMILSFFYST